MPTLIELLTDPVSLTVFGIYAALMLWEALFPARPLPPVKGWKWKGLLSFAVYFLLTSYLPFLWTEHLARFQLFDVTGLGVAAGFAIGLLVLELGIYVWHRAVHRYDLLWRTVHQMHHSAERLDTFSAFWLGPVDSVGIAAVGSICLTLIVGIDPQAAVHVIYVTTFFAVFAHTNVRTPRWLGYIIQRPESHSRHHERGVHHGNYADLPVLDMLFGTFHNPNDFAKETGFKDGDSSRVLEMLAFKDISSNEPATHEQWIEEGITADDLVQKRA
ncbi:MAG: sterol desaturase family protein [Flavobacteriales bacterium]|nr:sterol desaturase family protein [Flavobacteriales bacterium]